MGTRSERIVRALQQLQQFLPGPITEPGLAINVLTGAHVRPAPDESDEGHAWLTVTFPGGEPFDVNGDLYLKLQMIEDGRFVLDGPEGEGKVSKHVNRLSDHFAIKYELD